ncbi:hypothetical protein HNV08_15090 [Winogradskyella eckloniae]|uniref:hypothetical protein n=1 Tax=Winogradskyella eckloniae TaxID=1089306 RepID=UPI001563762D|nr:hypothetical protein [Winogradskyella eckloniae]NRD21380.1 hypothetical protein [Winogradskyella eckloniae]
MKTFKFSSIVAILLLVNCDNNDEGSTASIIDGFTINSAFYNTEIAYVSIDQSDVNSDGFPDNYNFFFTDGRITDTFGDQGVGYAYAFSNRNAANITLVIVLASDNPSLSTRTIVAGNTYVVQV